MVFPIGTAGAGVLAAWGAAPSRGVVRVIARSYVDAFLVMELPLNMPPRPQLGVYLQDEAVGYACTYLSGITYILQAAFPVRRAAPVAKVSILCASFRIIVYVLAETVWQANVSRPYAWRTGVGRESLVGRAAHRRGSRNRVAWLVVRNGH